MNKFISEEKPKTAALPARQRAKAVTRARILEVAKEQLESLGYERTSIRGVAQAAGVATGTVLLHCTDKADLLHTALFEDLEQAWQAAREKVGTRPLLVELSELGEAFFAYYAARPTLSRALLRESLFAAPPWSGRFAAQIADVQRVVVTLAEQAKARGQLATDVDSALLGASFFSFYYFALLAWLQGGHSAPERLFRALLSQHLNGLVPHTQR